MARRTTTRPFRRSSPNRSWSGSFTSVRINVPAATKVLLGSFALSNTNIDETILRTVGMLSVSSDQVSASEDQIGAFGAIVVNDLAVAAGAASIPGPITNLDDDGWFLYVPIVQKFENVTSAGFDPNMSVQYPFDSKAKRTTEEGFSIAFMVQNTHASNGFDVAFVIRILSMIRGT